jgi:O-antigen/teichoic acid export membrane protein
MYGVEYEDEESKKSAIYSGALIQAFCLGFLFLTVFVTERITTFPYPKAGLFYGIAFTLSAFFLNCTRGMDKEREYTIGFSIFHITNLICSLVLLVWKGLGAYAIFISAGIAYLVQVIYLESRIHIIPKFRFRYIKFVLMVRMLKFAFPLAFAAIGTWVMKYYSSIIIVKILGSKENGMYTMALNFARAIPTIANGLLVAWQEIAFSTRGEASNRRAFFQSTLEQVLITFACTLMLFIPAIHLVIPYYLDSAYSGIMPLITVCTVAFLFDCFSTILEGVFGNSINSMPILISTVVGTVTVLCIIVPLVTRFGTVGAAVTTAIGFFLVASIKLIWLSIENHFRMNVKRILFYLLSAGIVSYYATIGSVSVDVFLLLAALVLSYPYFRPMIKYKKTKKQE